MAALVFGSLLLFACFLGGLLKTAGRSYPVVEGLDERGETAPAWRGVEGPALSTAPALARSSSPLVLFDQELLDCEWGDVA